MTTMTEPTVTTQVYSVFIKATPEAIWDAITNPEWTDRYGYRGRAEYDLRPGGGYRAFASEDMRAHGAPEVVVEGQVIQVDAPRKLVQSWSALFGPETESEAVTHLGWELEAGDNGVTKVTVTHELEGAPRTAAFVGGTVPNAGGGWSFVLSDLKTLLETGKSLEG
jgi:uncharacterized protein YndB with AHSA1/START domain